MNSDLGDDEVFGDVLAESYDVVYSAKDTDAELELVVELWRRHEDAPTKRVLDLGCGTGRHAIGLATRGFDVVGVDRSPAMLAIARRKGAAQPSLRFVAGDARDVDVGGEFDAVNLLFTVLGYMATEQDVAAALGVVARHLRPGGLLVFDVWSAAALARDPPSPRERTFAVPGGHVVRRSSGVVDPASRTCVVDIEVERFEGDRRVDGARESHRMRMFAVDDLDASLRAAGLELVRRGSPPDLAGEPPPGDWSIWVLARKPR